MTSPHSQPSDAADGLTWKEILSIALSPSEKSIVRLGEMLNTAIKHLSPRIEETPLQHPGKRSFPLLLSLNALMANKNATAFFMDVPAPESSYNHGTFGQGGIMSLSAFVIPRNESKTPLASIVPQINDPEGESLTIRTSVQGREGFPSPFWAGRIAARYLRDEKDLPILVSFLSALTMFVQEEDDRNQAGTALLGDAWLGFRFYCGPASDSPACFRDHFSTPTTPLNVHSVPTADVPSALVQMLVSGFFVSQIVDCGEWSALVYRKLASQPSP